MPRSKNFHELGRWTGTRSKTAGRSGHRRLRNMGRIAFLPFRRAVQIVLIDCLRHRHDFYTLMMINEMEAMLKTLPYMRQGSTRGQSPKLRAQYILSNIHRQRSTKPFNKKPRSRSKRAAFQILIRALAVECFERWPDGATTTYKRTQTARQVYALLWSDKLMLYGRLKRQRISMQGQAVARYLYAQIEPIYRLWLYEHKAEIKSGNHFTTPEQGEITEPCLEHIESLKSIKSVR